MSDNETVPPEEVDRRRDEVVKRMLATPAKPRPKRPQDGKIGRPTGS